MKGVEAFNNTIKIFIDILDRALEIDLLFSSELGYCKSVRGGVPSMLHIE